MAKKTKKVIETGQSLFKGIMDIVDADEVAKGTAKIKKSAKTKVDEEQTQRQKVAAAGKKAKKKKKDETPKQREARLKKIKKAKETEKETPKQDVLDEEKVIQRIGETEFSSGAAEVITLGRQEAFDVINNLDRSGSQVPDRVLYGMSYISDEGIIKNAKLGPEALDSYLKKRENAFLKDFNQSPAMQKKYEAMAANNFNTVFEKLAREYTPVADPSDLMDRVIVGTMSDLTGTYDIAMINGIPVTLRHTGGTGFTSIIENVKKGVGWAADLGTMRKFSNRIAKVMDQTGKEVSVMPLDMSPGAVTFTSAIAQGLMQQIKATNAIQPSVKRAFDAVMRKEYPQWVGLDHPMAENQIAGIATDGLEEIGPGGRKFFDYMIASRQLQQLGFPDYFSTVRVLSKPGFMDRMLGSGQKIIKPKDVGDPIYAEAAKEMKKAGKGISETDVPNVPLLANLGIDNKTYNAGLAIEGFEKLASNVPAPILFRDAWKGMQGGLDEKGNPLTYAQKVNKLMTQHDLFQEVDEQWVESVTKYLQESAATNSRTNSGIILPGGQAGKVDPAALLGMFSASIIAMGAAPSIVEGAPFIGPLSKTFKRDIMDKAVQMEEAGASREEIWSSTFDMGQAMFRNIKDKMWRAEISAKNATVDLTKIKPHTSKTVDDLAVLYAKEKGLIDTSPNSSDNYVVVKAQDQFNKLPEEAKKEALDYAQKAHLDLQQNPYATLGEILDFPELFEAYPQMKDFQVGVTMDRYLKGEYDPQNNRILLNMANDADDIESTLFHEVNHGIEGEDLFSVGGMPDNFKLKNKPLNPQLKLRNRIKLLDGLEKNGYTLDDVVSQRRSIYDDASDAGYEMSDGKFVSAKDLGLTHNQFSKQPIAGSESKHLFEDKDFVKGLMEFEQAKTKNPRERTRNYKRLVGEAQARLVQGRRNLTDQQIKDNPPFLPRLRSENYKEAQANIEKNSLRFDVAEEDQLLSPDWDNPTMSGDTDAASEIGFVGSKTVGAVEEDVRKNLQYEVVDQGQLGFKVIVRDPSYKKTEGDRTEFASKVLKDDDEVGAIWLAPDGQFAAVDQSLLISQYQGSGIGVDLYNKAIEASKKRGFQGLSSNPEERNIASDKFWSKYSQGYRAGKNIVSDPIVENPELRGIGQSGMVDASLLPAVTVGAVGIPGLAADTGVGGLQESPEDAVDDAIEEAEKPLSLGQQIQQNTDAAKVNQVVQEIENIPMNNLQEAAQKFVKETVKDKVIQQKTNPEAASTDASIIGKMVRSDGNPSFLSSLEGVTGLPLREIGEYVSSEVNELVTGDKAFSALPSHLQGAEEANAFGGQTFTGDLAKDIKISYGLLFGQNAVDKVGVIAGNDPEARFEYYNAGGELVDASQADGSETVFVYPSRGPVKMLNSPGLSSADGTDLLGEAISYAPTGKAFMAINNAYKLARTGRNLKGLGTGGQAAVMGAGSFATELGVDAGLQALGSEEEINVGDSAFTAATMAAFPLAGGAAKAGYKKAGEYVDPIQKALEPAIRALNTPLMTGSKAAGMNKLPR